MRNKKIFSCPCCDSEIKSGVQLTGYMMMNKQYIKCDSCGLTIESRYDIDNLSQTQLIAITEDLIRRWNTRKPMERIAKSIFDLLNEYDINLWRDIEHVDLAEMWTNAIDSGILDDDKLKKKIKEFIINKGED